MALITNDRSYADTVVRHEGKAPSDLRALCVLTWTECGKEKFATIYPHERVILDGILGRVTKITVLWVDASARLQYPMLFPEPAGA